MPWPVHPTGFFGARGDSDTYRIERSLRFNSADSAYLNRTPASAGNRKTWTWSGWVKRSGFGSNQYLFNGAFNSSNQTNIQFYPSSSETLNIFSNLSGATVLNLVTTQVLRDPSAWYHIVVSIDTTQATSSNRAKLYINGSQVTSFSTETYPSQNADLNINDSVSHSIGAYITPSVFFNGYLTEINFIDGQALTPSSFGETDAITGRWKAKSYGGTYGTNGFYLNFADNSGTTSTTLGKDSSGNGNNWTPNNFSVTAGAGNDSLVDSPTNYGSDTGLGGEVRGNYAVFNPLAFRPAVTSATLSNGNLVATGNSAVATQWAISGIYVPSGKYYCEMQFTTHSSGSDYVGIVNDSNTANIFTSYSVNNIVGMALNADAKTVQYYVNNTPSGSAVSLSGSSFAFYAGINNTSVVIANFGQRPFAYTAPSGFKALCTQNLPQPTIQKSSRYMDALAYTGTGASNSISSLGFSPDLVWIKNRGTTTSHAIYDTTRGAQSQLSSDTTGDQVTSSSGLTSFDANGFTIGTSTLVNTSGTQYVAWGWDESVQAGMDIVSYTGNGANRTISHNLGVAPKMIIVKARVTASTDQGWPVYHASNTAAPETDYLLLNSTAASADLDTVWNDTAPTASVFSVGTNALVNTNNDTYIAYLFSEVEGFSKFGSYTGNNSTDGPFVWCGFRPKYILIKNATSTGAPWLAYDSVRSSYNAQEAEIRPNTNEAENGFTLIGSLDFLSNGFKIREDNNTSWLNTPSATFIFAAFAESPFKYARAR